MVPLRGWAQAELGMTIRSAERYMLAAAFLNGKPGIVSHLPPTILFALSAPTAPAVVVNEVMAAAETGILPPAKKIKVALACAIKEERAARMQSIKTPDQITEEDEQHRSDKQREAHRLADEQARKEQEASDKREREARLYPLVQRIADAIGPRDLAALAEVLTSSHLDRLTFGRLMSMTQASVVDGLNATSVANPADMPMRPRDA
jgi:hypothetical protein